MNIKGEYTIKNHETGEVYVDKHNLIVEGGYQFIINNLVEDNNETIINISLGKGSTAPTINDNGLENISTDKTLNNITVKSQAVNGSTATLVLEALFTSDNVNNTSEIGVFTNTGRMISRDTYSILSLPTGSTMDITYTYTIKGGE